MSNAIKKFFRSKKNRIVLFQCSNYFFVATLPLWLNLNTIALWLLVFSSIIAVPIKQKINNLNQNLPSLLIISGLYVLYLTGILYSENTGAAFRDIEKTLTLFLIPLILFSHPKKHFNEKKTILSLGVGLTTGILICWGTVIASILNRPKKMWLDQAGYLLEWVYTDWNLVSPLDAHPGYFGALLVVFIYGLFVNKNFEKLRNKSFVFIFFLIPYLVFLLALSSRIAIVSLLLLGGYYFLSINNKKKWFFLLFFTPLLVIIALNTDYLVLKFTEIIGLDGNIKLDRFGRWKDILYVFNIEGNYLWGVGTGDTQQLYNQAYLYGEHKLAYFNRYNAHSQYLEFFVGMGIIGLLYYLIVLGNWIKVTRVKSFSLAVILIVVLFSMSESIFKRSQGVFLFAYFYSLTIILFNSNQKYKT